MVKKMKKVIDNESQKKTVNKFEKHIQELANINIKRAKHTY